MDTSVSYAASAPVERGIGLREKRKTCLRYNVPGEAHFLTFSCYKQQALPSRDRSCQWLQDALSAARDKHALDLWAYIIMPEHVHLLIFPRNDDYSIVLIILDVKRPVARQAVRTWLRTRHRF